MSQSDLKTYSRIKPQELMDRLASGARLQLIDVRSAREFDEVHLPGAVNVPLEQVESRLADLRHDEPTVLVCQSGRRADICRGLLQSRRDELIVLEGGTKAWIDENLPVVRATRNRLPLMRQVQLIAGILVLVGAALGRFVEPNWAFLPMFVGAGLTLAGSTGFCGLASLLARMPWNQASRPSRGVGTTCPHS